MPDRREQDTPPAERPEGGDGALDWSQLGLSDLADHIVATHHALLRRELPRLARLIDEAAAEGDERLIPLGAIQRLYTELRCEIEAHTRMEEQVLFPLIRVLDYARAHEPRSAEGVDRYLREIRHNHDLFDRAMAGVREMTHGYQQQPDGSPALRQLIAALAAIEADMRLHGEKEEALIRLALDAEEQMLSAR